MTYLPTSSRASRVPCNERGSIDWLAVHRWGVVGVDHVHTVDDASLLERVDDLRLCRDDVDIDAGSHLLLSGDEDADSRARDVLEVLDHEHEPLRFFGRGALDLSQELWRGGAVQLAGECDDLLAVLFRAFDRECHGFLLNALSESGSIVELRVGRSFRDEDHHRAIAQQHPGLVFKAWLLPGIPAVLRGGHSGVGHHVPGGTPVERWESKPLRLPVHVD